MGLKEKINLKLILIYAVINISIFQSGVDFQMSMLIYYTPPYKCVLPNNTNFIATADNCFYVSTDTQIKKSCTKWKFDRSQIKSTLVTELKLICSRKYMQLILIPIRNLSGILVVIIGLLSDIKGRRIIFLFCVFMDTFIWILIGMIPSQYLFHAILRFCKIFGIGSSIIGFVLASELTPKKYRNIIIINYWSFFSVGLAISPFYNKFTSRWQTAWLFASWPMFFYILAPYIILESPKWLLVNDQKKKALIVLTELEQYSESPATEGNEFLEFKEEVNQVQEANEIFKSGLLMSRLGVLLLTNLSFYLVYQGISTNLEFAVSDIYINAMILGLVEIPAGPLGCLSRTYLGSVNSVVFWTIAGIVSYLIIPGHWDQMIAQSMFGKTSHLILAVFAKFFMIMSWNVSGVFFVGLFPTNKRNLFAVFSEVLGFIGAAIGGFVGYYYMNSFYHSDLSIAIIIYGIVLLTSMILFGLVIPSINNVELPNTVEEAKNIKKSLNCCLCVNDDKTNDNDK